MKQINGWIVTPRKIGAHTVYDAKKADQTITFPNLARLNDALSPGRW